MAASAAERQGSDCGHILSKNFPARSLIRWKGRAASAARRTMNTDDPSQADWVRAAMDQHAGPLLRYAATILGEADRARDVVQDAFVRLCAEDRRRVAPHLAEWLFTVCRHRAVDILRKENRMTALTDEDLEIHPSAAPSPGDEAERRDLHGHVLEALATLPKNQQEVVRLKFQNGLSYQEISRITQLTVTNVGFLIHTAIRTLRRRFQNELDAPVARRMP